MPRLAPHPPGTHGRTGLRGLKATEAQPQGEEAQISSEENEDGRSGHFVFFLALLWRLCLFCRLPLELLADHRRDNHLARQGEKHRNLRHEDQIPPAFPEPLRSHRPWQSSPTPCLRVIVSCRLGLLQVEFGHHLLAHDKFLDLAGHGHRKRLDKFNVAGNFVVRNLPATKLL